MILLVFIGSYFLLPEHRLQDFRILHSLATELSARDIPFPILKSLSPFEINLYDCRPQTDFRYYSPNQPISQNQPVFQNHNISSNQDASQRVSNKGLFTNFDTTFIGSKNNRELSQVTLQQRLQVILSELETLGVHVKALFKNNQPDIGFSMLIFNEESLLNAYLTNKGSLRMDIGGLYNSLTNEVIINASNPTLHIVNNIQHEATHAFTQHIWGETPIWFNEGLSSYFENLTIKDNAIRIQQDTFYLKLISHLYHTQQLLPLKTFIGLKAGDWHSKTVDQNQLTIFYGIAWSFMAFITQEHSDLFYLYSQELSRNTCQLPNDLTFFEENHPGGIEALEKSWLKYIITMAQK